MDAVTNSPKALSGGAGVLAAGRCAAFDLVLGLDILARQKIRLSYAESRLELG